MYNNTINLQTGRVLNKMNTKFRKWFICLFVITFPLLNVTNINAKSYKVNPLIPRFKDVPSFFYNLNKFKSVDYTKHYSRFLTTIRVITSNAYLICDFKGALDKDTMDSTKILRCTGFTNNDGNKGFLQYSYADFFTTYSKQQILKTGPAESFSSLGSVFPRPVFNSTILSPSFGSYNSFGVNFPGVNPLNPYLIPGKDEVFLLDNAVIPIGYKIIYPKEKEPEDYIKNDKKSYKVWLVNNSELICVVPDGNRFGCRDKYFQGYYFDDQGFHKFDHSDWFFKNKTKLKWNF